MLALSHASKVVHGIMSSFGMTKIQVQQVLETKEDVLDMQITFKSYLKLTGFGSILIPSINNTL
jgi:hypothetical protein